MPYSRIPYRRPLPFLSKVIFYFLSSPLPPICSMLVLVIHAIYHLTPRPPNVLVSSSVHNSPALPLFHPRVRETSRTLI